VEGNERCILATTADTEGIPYADAFSVQVRWVATKCGENDISIQVGVYVDFHKNTLLKGKIRSSTIEETTKVHERLVRTVERACSNEEKEPQDTIKPQIEQSSNARDKTLQRFSWQYAVLSCLIAVVIVWGMPSRLPLKSDRNLINLHSRLDKIEAEMSSLRLSLDEILAIMKKEKELIELL